MEDGKNHGLDSKLYIVWFMLADGSTKSYNNTFSDAMFQYITVGSALTNITDTSLTETTTVTHSKKNFFYTY